MSSDVEFSMTIDGRAVITADPLDVVNPATAAPFAKAPNAGASYLDDAVSSARRAFPSWAALPIEQRKAALRAMGARIREHAGVLTMLLTREQGKPLADAEFEIMTGAAWCEGTAALDLPVVVNEDSAERFSETRHVPIGVVGAIVPWNFPIVLALWKIAPALLAGNTMVVKPSPFTPLTTLKLGAIFRDLLPPGVLNFISGDDSLGPLMTAHAGIDKISFTGSTATGKKVMQGAANTLKRVTLELGGNDAAIVLPDVDIPAAAQCLFWAAFSNNGQVCIAAKRLYVHDKIYDDLAAELVKYARTVRMGDGAEPGIQLGPVQNRPQFERVRRLIDDTRRSGLDLIVGGEDYQGAGYFVPATIVDNPPDDSRVVVEEAFGPVVPMMRFSDIDDAIARANASDYGLAGSVWSRDLDKASAIARRLQCGTAWVNEIQYVSPFIPFAGHKQSGLGEENGVGGLMEYTMPQTLSVNRQATAF